MRTIATLLFLATAVSARADALADLKRTLTTLRGAAAIAAVYDARHTNKARGRFFNQNLNVHSAADVQVGEGGVTLTLSRSTLERLRAQRTSKSSEEDNREVTGDVQAGQVAELLDYAPTLQAMLARAVVVAQRDAALGVTPARLLVLKVRPERAPVTNVKIESAGDDLSLWIGRDGVPLAAERKAQFSVGFLFLKAAGGATEKWTFARRDDRLVVLRHERAMSGGGLGQSSEGTEIESIALR